MSNKDREKVWEERVAHWRASGLSQRAYAIEHGYPIRQVGYWVRRLTRSPTVPGLLPMRASPEASAPPADDACWQMSAEQWRWLVAGVDWQRLSAPAPAKWRL